MRTIVALTLALFVGGAFATGNSGGLGGSWGAGSLDLNLSSVTAAGSAGGSAAGVSGEARIPRNGTTRIRAWSHSDTLTSSTSWVGGACSTCGGIAHTATFSSSNANGGLDMNVRNDPATAAFSASADSFGYSEVDRTSQLSLSLQGGFVQFEQFGKIKPIKPGQN